MRHYTKRTHFSINIIQQKLRNWLRYTLLSKKRQENDEKDCLLYNRGGPPHFHVVEVLVPEKKREKMFILHGTLKDTIDLGTEY